MKKIPVVSIILGVLVLVYAFLAYFLNNDIFNLNQTIGNIVVALGLVAFAIFIVMPDMNKKSMKTLKTVEFLVIMLAAVFGFLLPLFNVKGLNLGSGSLWFGIALVLNGGIDLYLGINNKKSLKDGGFTLSLLSVIAGTYIYATNFVNRNLELFSFILLLALGTYLTVIGILNRKK